jgi:hypothetical protein
MSAKKATIARKKAPKKKVARKQAARGTGNASKARGRSRRLTLNGELPEAFVQMSRSVREGLGRLEKDIAKTEARYRKGVLRILDDLSEQLRDFEALGEERWHVLSDNARKDLAKLLRRLEKAVDPGPSGKRRAGKKSAARKKKARA